MNKLSGEEIFREQQKISDKEVLVESKIKFGCEKLYPICLNAKIFAKIARTTTLLPECIEYIKDLGYTVKSKEQYIEEQTL